jgi:hypothetical protein
MELKKRQPEIEARGAPNAKEQAGLATPGLRAARDSASPREPARTSRTHKRNVTKTFIFDVNPIWLTNLDRFNHRPASQRSLDETPEVEGAKGDPESCSLSGRRGDRAIGGGYSQIQSTSSE